MVLGAVLASVSWAEERATVEVESFLGEPLSAWLRPPSGVSPRGQVEVDSSSALALTVASPAGSSEVRLHLTSAHPLVEPVVQGTLRWRDEAGEGAMPFVLFLDPPGAQTRLPVPPGATLWRLAAEWPGPPGSTQAERMRALQAANPEAFLDGDPNRLRADAVLRLPTQGLAGTPPRQGEALPRVPSAPPEATEAPEAPAVPHLEVSPPSGDERLGAERAALAAALARAEADRAAAETAQAEQAAELAQLREQLAQQREALARLQAQLERFQAAQAVLAQAPTREKASEPRPGAEAWSRILEQAALGLSALAVLLGAGLLWRREGSPAPAPAPASTPTVPGDLNTAAPKEGDGSQAYVPSALVQRYGAQSLLSQRDWQACLDQVEMAIAYGHLEEAEALLTAAREEDPHAVPLRVKVLELAVERQNRSEFDAVAPALLRGADPALKRQIEALEARLPAAAQADTASSLRLAPRAPEAGAEHG